MSYTIHDAIVVTAFKRESIEAAWRRAVEIGLPCSPIVDAWCNGFATFLIAPDGSKEGWPESDAGDVRRARWIEWAREQWAIGAKSEGGHFLHFVHVRFGDVATGYAEIAGTLPDEGSAK